MRILAVAKDMGGANVILHILRASRAAFEEVIIVTEGLASEMFEKAGFPPYFRGTVNWQVEPFTLDANAVIRKVKPDVVVVAEGSPNHLEGEFGLAANTEKVPLVAVNDFWNGASRLQGAKPDLVLALDEYDASVSGANQPQAKTVIVGNPGCPTEEQIANLNGLPEVSELRKRFKKVYVYVGAGETTSAEIVLLTECLKQTQGNWCLIARFHPKLKNLTAPDGRNFDLVWREQLAVLGDRVVYLESVGKTDPIVVTADVTVSSFSTLLTTAAAAGRVAVSLWIPEVEASLKKQAGLDRVPVVALGCAEPVSSAMDLSTLTPASAENRAKLKPFDGEAAYQAIKVLVG